MRFDVWIYPIILLSVTMQVPGPVNRNEKDVDRDYRSLVDSIVSKNVAPKFAENGTIRDTDFDWEEQKRVAAKLLALSPRTTKEWAVLIEFLADDRYSISGYEKSPLAPRNYSVGQLCKDVARAQVNAPVLRAFAKHGVEPPKVISFPSCSKDLPAAQLALVDEAQRLVREEKLDEEIKKKLLRALDEVRDELKSSESLVFCEFSWDNISWLRKKQSKKE